MRTRRLGLLSLVLVAGVLFQPGMPRSAEITWSGPVPVPGGVTGAVVLNNGTTWVAENYGGANITINGVAFTGVNASSSATILEGAADCCSDVYQGTNSAMSPLLTTAFNDDSAGVDGQLFRIFNLTIGSTYTIQLFGGDERPAAAQPIEVDNGKRDYRLKWGFNSSGTGVLLQDQASFITGTFVADNPTQVFRVRGDWPPPTAPAGGAIVSGINVRWEPAPVLVTPKIVTSWSGADFVVQVQADIESAPLRSFGLRLNYNPGQLSLISAAKNEALWYIGRPANPVPYVDPDTSRPGQVVILGTRLDADDPASGVAGPTALLAELRFQPLNTAPPSLSLTRGRRGGFANFVTVDGTVLDAGSVSFAAIDGADADADGVPNYYDRCPWAADPLDVDSGGVHSPVDPTGAVVDGIGDVCQCGNVDDNGRVDPTDIALVRDHLAERGTPLSTAALDRCAVLAPAANCDLRTVVVVTRAALGLAPGVQQACAAAAQAGP